METGAVAVVGAGQIGRSVAHAFAEHGPVVLVDIERTALDSALNDIRRSHMGRFLRGACTVPTECVLSHITTGTDLKAVAECGLIVENVTEDPDLKLNVHTQLDQVCAHDAVIAANTSAVPLAFLASAWRVPGRLVGIHFMIPVPETGYVELIRHDAGSQQARTRAATALAAIGLRAVQVNDGPGFVANRVLMPMVNTAAGLVRKGVATAADVDAVFVGCNGHRMGPLAMADLIGLDTIVRTLAVLARFEPAIDFTPDPLLLDLVRSGAHGRKAGRGFFTYGGTTVEAHNELSKR